jgi:hypothetical protein
VTTDLERSPRWCKEIGLKSGSVEKLKGFKPILGNYQLESCHTFVAQSAVMDISLSHIVTL